MIAILRTFYNLLSSRFHSIFQFVCLSFVLLISDPNANIASNYALNSPSFMVELSSEQVMDPISLMTEKAMVSGVLSMMDRPDRAASDEPQSLCVWAFDCLWDRFYLYNERQENMVYNPMRPTHRITSLSVQSPRALVMPVVYQWCANAEQCSTVLFCAVPYCVVPEPVQHQCNASATIVLIFSSDARILCQRRSVAEAFSAIHPSILSKWSIFSLYALCALWLLCWRVLRARVVTRDQTGHTPLIRMTTDSLVIDSQSRTRNVSGHRSELELRTICKSFRRPYEWMIDFNYVFVLQTMRVIEGQSPSFESQMQSVL